MGCPTPGPGPAFPVLRASLRPSRGEAWVDRRGIGGPVPARSNSGAEPKHGKAEPHGLRERFGAWRATSPVCSGSDSEPG